MNFLLAREDAEQHAGAKSCFYCNKVFSNYRALGGHLRIHQEDRNLRTLNNPGWSSNSMDITRNPPASLPNSQLNSLAGGNNPIPFTRAPPAFDLPWMFCSNETNLASRSRFTGSNPGVAQTQIIMSPDLSYGCGNGATYHHNSLASRGFAPAGANAAISSSAFAPSGSVLATGFPTDPAGANAAMSSSAFASPGSVVASGFPIDSSLYLGSNGVCQFNTDGFQSFRDGLPPLSGDALQNIQGDNLGKLPNPTFSVTNPDLGFGSYQLPASLKSVAVCAFSPGPFTSSSLDNVGQYERRSFVMSEEGKRPYSADESGNADVMNAYKRTKFAPNAHVEPEKPETKELLLLIDVDDSISAPRTCSGADEEGPADVDLSLHL
ncbi:hypothetical protein PTKIN_Ptkin18bG0096300 [Pterospermum kingtungense]